MDHVLKKVSKMFSSLKYSTAEVEGLELSSSLPISHHCEGACALGTENWVAGDRDCVRTHLSVGKGHR